MSENKTYTRFEFLKMMGIGAGGLTTLALLPIIPNTESRKDISVQEYLDYLFTPERGSIREYRTASENLANMPAGLPVGISAISIDWFPGMKNGLPMEGIEVQYVERQRNIHSITGYGGPPNLNMVLTDKLQDKHIKFDKYRDPVLWLTVNFSPLNLPKDITDENDQIIISKNTSYTRQASIVLKPSAGGANKHTTRTVYFNLNESSQNWQIQETNTYKPNGLEVTLVHSQSQFFINGDYTQSPQSFRQEALNSLIPLKFPSN